MASIVSLQAYSLKNKIYCPSCGKRYEIILAFFRKTPEIVIGCPDCYDSSNFNCINIDDMENSSFTDRLLSVENELFKLQKWLEGKPDSIEQYIKPPEHMGCAT